MYKVNIYRNKNKLLSLGNMNFSAMCEFCDLIPWQETGPYLVSVTKDGKAFSDFKTNRLPSCVALMNS